MIELRTARPSDAPSIAKIHAHNWQTTYCGIYSDAFLDKDVTAERASVWRQRLESPAPNQVITVALLDGEVAGFACLFLEHDPVYGALLDNLHVTAEARGTGIGKQLMGKCAEAIIARSARHNMYLWVYVKNPNAIAVYDRLGGVNAGVEPQHPYCYKFKAPHRRMRRFVYRILPLSEASGCILRKGLPRENNQVTQPCS